MNAKEIASFLNCEILGNPLKEITRPGYLYTAKPDELAYCFLKDDEKDLEAIRKTNAGIVICQKHLKERLKQLKVKSTLILSETPKYDFARILQEFFVKERPAISPYAYVSKNVKIGKNVNIHPGAVIYGNTIIGNRVTIRANAVVGAEGLDYGRNKKGELKRIPHLSYLIIEDDVDIGSNTTVQKGMLRPTIIGEGTKVGPNCDIGHEVKIGKYCIITGMTLIAGATEIGDYTYIAPHSTIKNSIKIGSNVFVGIGSLVINDVPDGTTVVGRPAIEIEKFREQRKRLKELLRETL
jgi:UDP-3-O-[3-hydroxymyristoyl] glucosamine N-acyltransferase